jgi:hypothetical protein
MELIENRNDLLKKFNKNLKIAEIGVFKGEFSKIIFEELQPNELHLIDIFMGTECSGDKDGNNVIFTDLSKEYDLIVEHFKTTNNVYIHKGNSQSVLNNFEDEYFDMIYIDGDHSYNGVKNDLNLSYNKIKSGGYICGHDYTTIMFEGVVRAVNEFCEEKKLKIKYLTKDGCPSFCIVKK